MVHSAPQNTHREASPPALVLLTQAQEGSREINIALGQALGLIDADLYFIDPDGRRVGRGNCDPWPDWTGDLDCAVGLVDRVLPGLFISLERFSDGWYATLRDHSTSPRQWRGTQKPAALALCVAVLHASIA